MADSAISVTVNQTPVKEVDDLGRPKTVYIIQVKAGDRTWELRPRYTRIRELYDALTARFPPSEVSGLPTFPGKTLFVNQKDEEDRARLFEVYLNAVIRQPLLRNSWPVQHFFELRAHLGKSPVRRILFPLPDKDFDPTEVAIPWKLLSQEGYECIFATEQGAKPSCDQLTLETFPRSRIYASLGAGDLAREAYKEMEQHKNFVQPIAWHDINAQDYDALFCGGGHAPGMKQYLESATLQQKLPAFFAMQKPVAAICHGVLLLARCQAEDGTPLLRGRKTTTLPKYLENSAALLTRMQYKDLVHTYPNTTCEEEVRQLQGNDPLYFDAGPMNLLAIHATIYDDKMAHVVEDGNYMSGRFPGDAYLLAKKLIEKLLTLHD